MTAAREPAAGAPRDPRAADRGRARGVGAAAVAVRALRAGRRARRLRRLARASSSTRRSSRTGSRPGSGCSCSASACSALFIGVAMVAPSLARPLASVLGRPATVVGGVAGDLARSNSMRNPGRTASTAAALMIGLALVTVVAVLAQGLKAQFESAVSSRVPRRLRAHLAERLHADRRSTRPTAIRKSGHRDRRRRRARGRRPGVRQDDPGHRRRPGDLADARGSTGRPARTRRSRRSGCTARSSTRATRRTTTWSSARRSGSRRRAGKFLDLQVKAIVAPPRGGSPLGAVTISSAGVRLGLPEPAERLHAS